MNVLLVNKRLTLREVVLGDKGGMVLKVWGGEKVVLYQYRNGFQD